MLKVEFQLTDAQEKVLKELVAVPDNKGLNENEACRRIIVQTLINTKQQQIASELSKS